MPISTMCHCKQPVSIWDTWLHFPSTDFEWRRRTSDFLVRKSKFRYGHSLLNELLRSKVKNGKVKKHHYYWCPSRWTLSHTKYIANISVDVTESNNPKWTNRSSSTNKHTHRRLSEVLEVLLAGKDDPRNTAEKSMSASIERMRQPSDQQKKRTTLNSLPASPISWINHRRWYQT